MRIQADYRNSNVNRYKNAYLSNTNKNDVSFEGLNLGKIFSRSKSSGTPEKAIREYTYQIAGYLGLRFDEVAQNLRGLNRESRDFLYSLSRKYSNTNFFMGGNLKEDPNIVFDILQKVEKPKGYHYSVVSNVSGGMEYLSKIFSASQDKKSMEFVLDFQNKLLKHNLADKNMLIEMLNSPFKTQYMKNIDDFKSYIILNKENPEAIKELDLLMQNQQYNRKDFDIRLAVNKVLNSQHLFSGKFISRDNLEKHYSMSGIELLDKFMRSYHLNNGNRLSAKSEQKVLEMYKTANKNNIEPRLNLIEKFKFELQKSDDKIDNEISTMKKLFDLMDFDKHAMKFVDKVSTTTGVKFDSIQQLYDVMKELTPRKANIFSENVFRIVRRVDGDELIPTLKEQYNNPFFETKTSKYHMEQMIRYRYKQPESHFSKLKRAVLNKINEYRLAREEKQIIQKPVSANTEEIISEKPQIKEVKSTVIEEKPIKPAIVEEKPIVEQKVPEKVENAMPFEWNIQKALPLKIKLTNTVKESPKARKLRLIGEVNEFISKKLSAKTVEKQSDIYGKNATKMRLKMLPEIFASIKETRQTDRAVGKFKSISANKDAVDLYRLINGSNRKYIKYLLEKRNVDGTRMFEVKDIIAMVEKANKRVDAMKRSNPDFKAKDAKAYFDHLYEAKIEQYGKVKRTKKK